MCWGKEEDSGCCQLGATLPECTPPFLSLNIKALQNVTFKNLHASWNYSRAFVILMIKLLYHAYHFPSSI
jgi:hypothetical protein